MQSKDIISNFPNNLGKTNFIGNLTLETIKNIDSDYMYSQLTEYWDNFSSAINEANAIREDAVFFDADTDIQPDKILIFGIGGSAVSGEIYRSYLKYILADKCPIIEICRGTEMPNRITQNTHVYICSYSGNTEETLSAMSKVEKFTTNIMAITSGGTLADICEERNYPVLFMPTDMMPRCAIYYSLFRLIISTLRKFNIDWHTHSYITNSIEHILKDNDRTLCDYSILDDNNMAIAIARILHNKIPLIYTAQCRLEAVNLRWKAQIQENANQLCFGNFFPELNHNEINSWCFPANMIDKFVVVVMKDPEDDKELNNRIDNSMKFLKEKGISVIEIPAPTGDLFERIIRLICLGDWVSFYLAIMNNVDPTPIPLISELKNRK
ncbi:MAG: hypothetical protein LBO69_08510 [Ignavibacteria bacterium]|jgi:glucose/mannose-6-phosphate isomerase|nr:hypothetical protein [Ignavibacteria bacterium]